MPVPGIRVCARGGRKNKIAKHNSYRRNLNGNDVVPILYQMFIFILKKLHMQLCILNPGASLKNTTQRTHNVMITSLLRQIEVATLWRNNNIIIAPHVPRVGNSVPSWSVSLWLLWRGPFDFCDGVGEAKANCCNPSPGTHQLKMVTAVTGIEKVWYALIGNSSHVHSRNSM